MADNVLHLDNFLRLLDILVFVGCHWHLAQSKLDLQFFCAYIRRDMGAGQERLSCAVAHGIPSELLVWANVSVLLS